MDKQVRDPVRPQPDAGSPDGHVPVLLEEAVEALALREGGVYVDGTFGGGGHSRRILAWNPPVRRVVAIDADPVAEARAQRLAASPGVGDRLVLVRRNFRHLSSILASLGLSAVDGVLLDLGVSSFQLDDGARGFSFRAEAPLDMRFDPGQGIPASDVVATMDEQVLANIFWELGEERQSRRIARSIVRVREREPITTTGRLAAVVEEAVGGRRGARIHPATRVFQALRIYVNDELGALRDVLAAATDHLLPGGRLVVITFHSLEDRIVKRHIGEAARTCVCPPDQPVCTCDTVPVLARVGRAIRPDSEETDQNPRSRSAIMRVAERLDAAGARVERGNEQ